MRNIFYIAALLCMVLVSGCASKEKTDPGPLVPLPGEAFNDPGNEQFMQAITDYLRVKGAPENSRYEFTRIDLNGDGRREGIVMMKAPHQYWCGMNGCNMAVFRALNNRFELVSEISPVRGPLTVSEKKTNGWNDLVIRVSGRMHIETKDVALQYDGKSYPLHPAFQPPVRYAFNTLGGVRIFP